jgi:hypothetical protein
MVPETVSPVPAPPVAATPAVPAAVVETLDTPDGTGHEVQPVVVNDVVSALAAPDPADHNRTLVTSAMSQSRFVEIIRP